MGINPWVQKSLFPQIGAQDFGNGDAAVTVLILFDDCGDDAAGRQAEALRVCTSSFLPVSVRLNRMLPRLAW